jgi:hypothetical protein
VNVGSLEELGAAFREWRSKKRHAREAVPGELVERARLAASVHGRGRVARTVKIDCRRLIGAPGSAPRTRVDTAAAPTYSRVEMVAPAVSARPFAELEMPNGIKLRLFAQTQETLGLITSMCVAGGAR